MKRKTRGKVQVEVKVTFDRGDADAGQVRKFEMLMTQLLKPQPNKEASLPSQSKASNTSELEDDFLDIS